MLSSSLSAYYAEYYIKALGLKIVKLRLEHDVSAKEVKVSAKSVMANKMFPRIDNLYSIKYCEHYLPQTYRRDIDQDSNRDIVSVNYDRETQIAKMSMSKDKSVSSYVITKDTRDYFSFLTMLLNDHAGSGSYKIDGNGKLWQADVIYQKTEEIKTALGKIKAKRYRISFKALSTEKAPYIDMVTHNLLNEDTKVTLWISENKVALKANVSKKLISMSWDLISYGL